MDDDVKGLRKEHKKLSDTLKTHRKRLERLSDAYAMTTDATAPTELLQSVLAELQHVKQLLTDRMMEDEESSSSSSESDDEMVVDTRMDWKQQQRQAQAVMATPAMTAEAPTTTSAAGAPPSLLVHTLHGDLEVPSSPRFVSAERRPSGMPEAPSSPLGDAPVARVVVCQGSKCADRGAQALLASASQVAASYDGMLEVATCKCLGCCKEGPAMKLQAAVNGGVSAMAAKTLPRSVHTRVEPGDVRSLVAAHLEMQQQALVAMPRLQGAQGRSLEVQQQAMVGVPPQSKHGLSPVAELLLRASGDYSAMH